MQNKKLRSHRHLYQGYNTVFEDITSMASLDFFRAWESYEIMKVKSEWQWWEWDSSFDLTVRYMLIF